jgi:hypothetical protein
MFKGTNLPDPRKFIVPTTTAMSKNHRNAHMDGLSRMQAGLLLQQAGLGRSALLAENSFDLTVLRAPLEEGVHAVLSVTGRNLVKVVSIGDTDVGTQELYGELKGLPEVISGPWKNARKNDSAINQPQVAILVSDDMWTLFLQNTAVAAADVSPTAAMKLAQFSTALAVAGDEVKERLKVAAPTPVEG